MHLGAIRAVERVEGAPVAGENVPVDLLEGGIDPAFDRAAIDVRRQPQARVAGLAPPDAVGVGAVPRGIKVEVVATAVDP